MIDPAAAATPDRTIAPPPPRVRTPEPDLSRMLAEMRAEAPAAAVAENPPTAAAQGSPQPPQKATRSPKRAPAVGPLSPVSAQAEGPVGKNTTYLSDATRNRGRAAYRATSQLEDDTSWSDFVEKAIAAEAERRETLYNGGQRYTGDNTRLRAGRPLGQ